MDIAGDGISDKELADYIVKDMRLLMMGEVRILNKEVITEKYKHQATNLLSDPSYIDLTHIIYDGLVTYKGLPAPIICDYLSREASREKYAPGTEFQIGKIEMITNTGSYVDCPFHRYEDGKDLSEVTLEKFADLDGIIIRVDYRKGLAIRAEAFKGIEIRNRAHPRSERLGRILGQR